MTIDDLKGRRVLILGLGVNNREMTAYLLAQGVRLTVRERDETVREQFLKAHSEFAELIEWQPRDGLSGLEPFEIIFRSPGIPFLSLELQTSQATIYSQTKLFFDLCPCQIVGITGTNGKGTTATLAYQMLSQGYDKGETYLAGNIGEDPFVFLDRLTPDDIVILELSSFQLQDLHKSPQVAVLLGISPDHLEKHHDMDEYVNAKGQILAHQKSEDLAIVNDENLLSASLIAKTPAKVQRYSKHLARRESAWAATADGDEIAFVQVGEELESISLRGRRLPGEYNLENILPALLVGAYFGVSRPIMQKVVTSFAGLPHRLTLVTSFGGVDYYDDSIATTPEAVQVKLRSFPGRPIHLIAGGGDKGADYLDLATDIVENCASLSLLPGPASLKIKRAVKKTLSRRSDCSCLILDKAAEPLFETILSGIAPHLQEGDIVLLSPAANSLVSFVNYKERGDLFAKAVIKRQHQ